MAFYDSTSNFYSANINPHEHSRSGRRLRRHGAPPSKREQITAASVVHGPAHGEVFAQYHYAHTHQHEAEQWPLYSNENAMQNLHACGMPSKNFRGIGPKDYSRSDTRILEDICEYFANDADVDATDIAVDVQAGIVTLSGTVTERRQKFRAELIADAVRGVRDIDNRLTVQRTETWQ